MRHLKLPQALATLRITPKGQVEKVLQAARDILQTNAGLSLRDAALSFIAARLNSLGVEFIDSRFDIKHGKELLPAWLNDRTVLIEDEVELMSSMYLIDEHDLLKLAKQAISIVCGADIAKKIDPYLHETQYSHELRLRLR